MRYLSRWEIGLKRLLFLFPLLFSVSCSDQTLELFFDIPPSEKKPAVVSPKVAAAEKAEKKKAAAAPFQVKREDLEIEKTETWEKAFEMLPKDQEGPRGRPNLIEAMRKGIIDPRASIDGTVDPKSRMFTYDFYFPTEKPEFAVYFPHSTHTMWLGCDSCHPKLFPLRVNKFTKKDLKKGKYCGFCHTKKDGGVAFWLKSCTRCHPLWVEE